MKKLFSFLSFHNAVPLAAVVLTMGAGITFAASQGALPLSPVASLSGVGVSAPESVDASALLAADLDAFDFRTTVTGVVETDMLYTISYSMETLAPEGNEWTASSKTGEFSVAKDTLGDSGLNAYVVGKLHDIENGERSYLSRAQTAEKALAEARQARPASAFSALVGLALDQIFVPVVAKPAPEPQPQTPPVQEATPTQEVTQEQTVQTASSTVVEIENPADTNEASSTPSTDSTSSPQTEATTTEQAPDTPPTITEPESTTTPASN